MNFLKKRYLTILIVFLLVLTTTYGNNRTIQIEGYGYIQNVTIPDYNIETVWLIELNETFCPPETIAEIRFYEYSEPIVWQTCSNISILENREHLPALAPYYKEGKPHAVLYMDYKEPVNNESFHFVTEEGRYTTKKTIDSLYERDGKFFYDDPNTTIYKSEDRYAIIGFCLDFEQESLKFNPKCYPLIDNIDNGKSFPPYLTTNELVLPYKSRNRYNIHLSYEYNFSGVRAYCPFAFWFKSKKLSVEFISREENDFKTYQMDFPEEGEYLFQLDPSMNVKVMRIKDADNNIIISKPEEYYSFFLMDKNASTFYMHLCTYETDGKKYFFDGINVHFLEDYSDTEISSLMSRYINGSEPQYGEIKSLKPEDIEEQYIELIGSINYAESAYTAKLEGIIQLSNESKEYFGIINVTDGENAGKTVHFFSYDYNNSRYEYTTKVDMKGDSKLFPFDVYTDRFFVAPPSLKKLIQEPILLEDGTELIAFFDGGQVIVEKRRTISEILGYGFYYIIYLIGIYLLFDYYKYIPKPKFTSKVKIGALIALVGIFFVRDILVQNFISILTALYVIPIIILVAYFIYKLHFKKE